MSRENSGGEKCLSRSFQVDERLLHELRKIAYSNKVTAINDFAIHHLAKVGTFHLETTPLRLAITSTNGPITSKWANYCSFQSFLHYVDGLITRRATVLVPSNRRKDREWKAHEMVQHFHCLVAAATSLAVADSASSSSADTDATGTAQVSVPGSGSSPLSPKMFVQTDCGAFWDYPYPRAFLGQWRSLSSTLFRESVFQKGHIGTMPP